MILSIINLSVETQNTEEGNWIVFLLKSSGWVQRCWSCYLHPSAWLGDDSFSHQFLGSQTVLGIFLAVCNFTPAPDFCAALETKWSKSSIFSHSRMIMIRNLFDFLWKKTSGSKSGYNVGECSGYPSSHLMVHWRLQRGWKENQDGELVITPTLIRATPPLTMCVCMNVHVPMYMGVYIFIPYQIDFVKRLL